MKKLILTLGLVCSMGVAMAETGTLETTYIGTYAISTNDLGDSKYSLMNIKLGGDVTKSSVSFFKVGDVVTSDCLVVAKSDSSGGKAEGTCLAVDKDGDKWKATLNRTNEPGKNNMGTQVVTGLTGKYVGMTGKCTYENKTLTANSVVWGVSHVSCTLSK